ncbi:hypothetical protein QZH41_005256 [Actinostola sp. cb2023]|nr:hypothetical protein QZH41_005256 [Actinostola sp. cb2023]
MMVLADGSSSPFEGRGLMKVKLGEDDYEHTIWVANIGSDGILGLDFMRKYGGQIVLLDGRYKLSMVKEGRGLGTSEQQTLTCSRVTVESTTVVPPRSETIISGRLDDSSGNIGVLEPTSKFLSTHKLLLARTLVTTSRGVVPLRVLNLTDQPCTVYRGTVAALCDMACEVAPREQHGEKSVACRHAEVKRPKCDDSETSDVVPDHLKDLLERSSRHLDGEEQEQLRSLLTEYADVFTSSSSDLGRTNLAKHTIDTGDAKPIRQPARRLPMHRREEAEQQVQKMLKDGIAEPSASPWASPIVLVRKRDGSMRFCVDYRKLNEVTVKDSYPLPTIDSCFDALSGSKWFSTLDLSSGYWQVEMDQKDKEKTAFTTGSGGLYHFTVMAFGLCNAPATFERLMEKVLSGLSWEICLAYIDDIIVHAKTFQAEKERLREVLKRMRAAGLKLSPKKCHLFQQSVEFLGHIVSSDGISTNPEKVKAVRESTKYEVFSDFARTIDGL